MVFKIKNKGIIINKLNNITAESLHGPNIINKRQMFNVR